MQRQPPRTGWRIVAALFLCALAASSAVAFDFEDVAREAERVARAPYRKPPPADPALAMSYDAYRKLRFKNEHSTWRDSGTPFELRYFPLGRTFTRPLVLHEIVGDQVRRLELPPQAFEGTASNAVAGFRLHRWVGEPRRSEEVGAFLGASYFRLVAQGLRYGLSARGLAVDTVGGSAGEEFPAFTTYWLQRPQPGDTEVRFYALLESPRVTGAYAFVLRPTAGNTVAEVRARLILRAPVARLGVAPLTSMFLGGENQPPVQDYRPEVHDSDGLQVLSGGGEWLWRPLVNPGGVFVTSHAMAAVRGFGLMQRDRAFTSYQDLEAHYELRPSAWVEPLNDWGPGRVELLQFRTPDETHDNVGAYWVPDKLAGPGQPMEFAWRVTITDSKPLPPGAWVVQSRYGHGYREGKLPAGRMQFHLDFAGPALQGLSEEEVEAVATGNHNVRDMRVIAQPNPAVQGWRVTLDYERVSPQQPVELRAFLRAGSRTLSETWSHALPPE
jgi:periplasmic glucans biosynthesis protein